MGLSDLNEKILTKYARAKTKYSFKRQNNEKRKCCLIRLDKEDNLSAYDLITSSSRLTVKLVLRKMYKLLTDKQLEWLVEGDDFYCAFEYGALGIVVKYYFKDACTIYDVYNGIMGSSNEIWLNEQYTTKLSFDDILAKIDNLKLFFTAKNYSRKMSHNFANVFGMLLDSSFNLEKLNFSKKIKLNHNLTKL